MGDGRRGGQGWAVGARIPIAAAGAGVRPLHQRALRALPGPVPVPAHAQEARLRQRRQEPGAPAAQAPRPAALPHQPRHALPGPHCPGIISTKNTLYQETISLLSRCPFHDAGNGSSPDHSNKVGGAKICIRSLLGALVQTLSYLCAGAERGSGRERAVAGVGLGRRQRAAVGGGHSALHAHLGSGRARALRRLVPRLRPAHHLRRSRQLRRPPARR